MQIVMYGVIGLLFAGLVAFFLMDVFRGDSAPPTRRRDDEEEDPPPYAGE